MCVCVCIYIYIYIYTDSIKDYQIQNMGQDNPKMGTMHRKHNRHTNRDTRATQNLYCSRQTEDGEIGTYMPTSHTSQHLNMSTSHTQTSSKDIVLPSMKKLYLRNCS